MPRGDGTGPMGMGSLTGRAAGYCAGYGVPGYANPGYGRNFGMGFGRGRGFVGGGRGWRHCFYATGQPGWMRYGQFGAPMPVAQPDPVMEKQALKAQADALATELEFIKKRLAEMESDTGAE